MNNITENKFCLPSDDSTEKLAIPLSLSFEFVVGNYTPLRPFQSTGWRTMPFHLCCTGLSDKKAETALIEISGKDSQTAVTDDIIFIPAGTHHMVSDLSEKGKVSLWLHFRMKILDFFDVMDFFELPNRIPSETAGNIQTLIAELVSLPKQLDFYGSLQQQLLGNRLVLSLLEHGVPRKRSRTWHADLQRMMPVFRSLSEMEKDCSTNELAKKVNLSPSRFLALFHRLTGSSPGKYREKERFRRACEMLLTDELTISEIADRLGYSDPFHFSRRFKDSAGICPREFKQKKQLY